MAFSATIRQWRTETPAGKFKLDSEIIAQVDMNTLMLFTRLTSGDIYVRVSDVRDLVHYLESPGSPDDYYRVNTSTQEFDTIEEAEESATLQKTDLQSLVSDFDTYTNQFVAGSPESHTRTTGDTSATIELTRTVEIDGKFKLVTTVTDASGFTDDSEELFVFKADNTYQHVARVGDMETYLPEGDPEGAGDPFDRRTGSTLEYDSVTDAVSQSTEQKNGIDNLVDDYEDTKDTYKTVTYEDTEITS